MAIHETVTRDTYFICHNEDLTIIHNIGLITLGERIDSGQDIIESFSTFDEYANRCEVLNIERIIN